MAEKPTTMVLNVDLQCSKCYKKVKKLLCKFPEIRDQMYDEKGNKVTIKVVCCSPEKIRDKLCCKGGDCIKSIEIKKPEEKPPKKDDKPPEKEDKPPAAKPKKDPVKVSIDVDVDLKLQRKPPSPGICCSDCCRGRPWGPCYCGCRVQCDPCYGKPIYESWSGHGSGFVCYTEENPPACPIM